MAAALLRRFMPTENPLRLYIDRRRLDEITRLFEFNFQRDVSGALMAY